MNNASKFIKPNLRIYLDIYLEYAFKYILYYFKYILMYQIYYIYNRSVIIYIHTQPSAFCAPENIIIMQLSGNWKNKPRDVEEFIYIWMW